MAFPIDHLYTYAAIIKGKTDLLAITEKSTSSTQWLDQGYTVKREVCRYRFENEVVIEHIIEKDDFPCDAACADMLISYTVIDTGNVGAISPAKQSFNSPCREAFWLTYHMSETSQPA